MESLAQAKRDESTRADPVDSARETVRAFVEFCTSDPVRYQLLFQRTIPGFEPSPKSWAVALEADEQTRADLAVVGVNDQATVDMLFFDITTQTNQESEPS